jgi:hypothetical protein
LSANPALSQTNVDSLRADTRIAGGALMEDVDVLQRTYTALHPGLYRYQSPAECDLAFCSLRERLKNGATLAETYVAFAEFAATIRCGHTYPNFFNQPKEVVAALFTGTNRLPFEFRWLGERMVVTRNLSDNPGLAPGAEIIAINAVPARDVLRRLMKLARADGSNNAKRRSLLEVQGSSRYESFDIFYGLCFSSAQPQFDLIVRPLKTQTNLNLRVEALSYAARVAALKVPMDKLNGQDSIWAFSFLNDRAAILRMPTWALYNSKWDWQTFLSGVFTNLSAHPGCGLIIDLRDNEGGYSLPGDVILRHLIKSDLPTKSPLRYTRFQKVPKDLIPHLDTWDWSFLDWGTNAIAPAFHPNGNAVFCRLTLWDDNPNGDVLHPLAPRFAGRVLVLMNSQNSSATFQFEEIAQQNHLAMLIGQPSGGNLRGINGSAFFFLHLPNSKIEMDVPLVATLPARPMPDAGLQPDKKVDLTPEGLATGKDEILAAALRYLRAPLANIFFQ